MMRIKFFIAIISLTILISNALSAVGDTIIIKSDASIEKISADLDSLVNSWYVSTAPGAYSELPSGDAGEGIMFSDSVYVERLARLNTIIKIRYNSIIRNHIHVYTVNKRELFSAILGLKEYYFPMIEDIFDSHGIPTELKYMAIIESALNPNAVSRVGATGLWQFMNSTGRMYGLTVNSVVDERRDPVKATHAAARYMKDLYNIYKDWILVIAAYNCGPGNVNKAIRRSDNRKDYWEIYYRLPRETRGYIPGYIAAAYAVNFYEEHNIRPLPLNFPVATDTIMIDKDMHLTQISEVMGIPEGELRMLNPQYRTGLVPGLTKPMPITLPLSHLSDFIGLNDTIRGYKAEIYLNKNISVADPARSAAGSSYTPPDVKGRTKLVYTVKEGDNLGYISEWYRVGLSDLRYWNNIYRNTIRIGQKLSVFVEPSKADFYARVDKMSFAEKQTMIGKSVPLQPQSSQLYTGGGSDGEYITYTVRYGDTIWNIVKKYDSVTISDILSLNNITDPQKIQVGQVLRIKKKS
jgi:membrane-bound lytic murein transglycosylase D